MSWGWRGGLGPKRWVGRYPLTESKHAFMRLWEKPCPKKLGCTWVWKRGSWKGYSKGLSQTEWIPGVPGGAKNYAHNFISSHKLNMGYYPHTVWGPLGLSRGWGCRMKGLTAGPKYGHRWYCTTSRHRWRWCSGMTRHVIHSRHPGACLWEACTWLRLIVRRAHGGDWSAAPRHAHTV